MLHTISKLSTALAVVLILDGCHRGGPRTDIDPAPPEAVQRSATAGGADEISLVAPHRYLRLSELASAIRKAGHACERVRAYKHIGRNDKGSSAYRVDCL